MKTPTLVGPLMLSTQPGNGSLTAPTTMEGLTMEMGRSPRSSFIICSVMAFVKEYVLGRSPMIILVSSSFLASEK